MNEQDLFCKNTEEIRRHIGDNSTVFLLLCIVETLLSPNNKHNIMKRAFIYKDEKSHKFWWIDYSGCDFAVNYGKFDSIGKFEIKDFDTEEECLKQAEKLIDSSVGMNGMIVASDIQEIHI